MKIYHQCGHNYRWNIDSLQQDGAGTGLIISPVNIEYDRVSEIIPDELLTNSWLDPQFYRPDDNKGKLSTYPFFPTNVIGDFKTGDYLEQAYSIARDCLIYQNDLGLEYLIIPTRHFGDIPDDYLEQITNLFVDPFLYAKNELGLEKPVLLTLIARPSHLEQGDQRDEILSWATAFEGIDGIYLIFDYSIHSKQIKEPDYLWGMLSFINALRKNELEVHVGYCGLEGLLLSVADPTSVTVGSYENLRSFAIERLITKEKEGRTPPKPRIYSGHLLQWIANEYIPAFNRLLPDWQDYFDNSPYRDYLLTSGKTLNFQRSEIYKHYFYLFHQQVMNLPDLERRPDYIIGLAEHARELFDYIAQRGIVLDSDSDGSHLAPWITAINMYKAEA